MIDLKRCPFCSCYAEIRRELFAGEIECFYVSCKICGARGQICNTEEEATKKWNTRKKPYESRKKLPCPKCGTARPEIGFSVDMTVVRCRNCDLKVCSKTEIGAIRAWNAMKREEQHD